MIIAWLPFGIRLKWCDAVDRIIKKKTVTSLADIMDFVASKVGAATHPMFSKVCKLLRKTPQGRGFSTQGTPPQYKVFIKFHSCKLVHFSLLPAVISKSNTLPCSVGRLRVKTVQEGWRQIGVPQACTVSSHVFLEVNIIKEGF